MTQPNECMSENSIRLSVDRVDSAFFTPKENKTEDICNLLKDFMLASGTSFDNVNAKLVSLHNMSNEWNKNVQVKFKEVDVQLDDHQTKIDFLHEKVNALESKLNSQPSVTANRTGPRPDGQPIYLQNFPENPSFVITELHMDQALTPDVYSEIRLTEDHTLKITCVSGAMKQRVCCWLKSNLANLQLKKITLTKGLLGQINGNEVKHWDKQLSSKNTKWVQVPNNNNQSNFG